MPQITNLVGDSSSSKPIGVIAWMMNLEGTKLTFMNLLLIFASIYLISFDFLATKTSNKIERLFLIFRHANLGSQILWIVTLRSQRWRYIEMIELFENQTRCNLGNTRVRRHLTKIRHLVSCYVIAFLMLSILITVFYKPLMILYDSKDYLRFGKSLTFGLFNVLTILVYPLYIQFLVESCLHIHACWLTVEEHMRLLKNNDSRALTIEKIREVRSMYSIAAVITEKMDSFLRFPIAIFSAFFIIANFIFFVRVWTEFSIIGLARYILRFSIFSFVIWNMIYIHYLTHKSFDEVYSLSYGKHTFQVNNEIHLFLDRIGQSNVGFSFLKISLITPTFVTSLASLTLTFVLSLPSLIEEII
uniref:Gustatory receptor n=1 Tax=Tetranychus urticae TaxID=32264 RepID=T1KL55_TETUR